VVRDGRPWADGAPLADTAAWRLESSAAPTSLTDTLPDAVPVLLATVRNAGALRSALRAGQGSLLVCDAETDADLERIASAALELGRDGDVAVAGSSALATALGRLLGAPSDSEIPARAVSAEGRAAFVVGTGEPRARAQVAALRAGGAHVVALDPLRLLTEGATGPSLAAVCAALASPVSVLTLDGGAGADSRSGGQLSRRLAELVATACAFSPPGLLTLTGGETARSVLDALSVRRITVRGTINGGAALSTTDLGLTVVTRPGSFGADDDFLRILERVSPSRYATLST
jgi:4-hydroxythreonine-4-phosphate dehydrogenase